MPNFNQADEYFKSEPYNLKELFVKNTPFEIPDYQRSFAWTEDNFETLWNDIVETEKRNFSGFSLVVETSQKPHFIGAIVSEMPSGLQGTEQVIDGQQRLTTLTILLSVLGDFIQEISDPTRRQNLLSSVFQLVRVQDPSGLTSFQSRVKLNNEHSFFFTHVISPANATVRQQGLSQCTNLTRIQSRIKECVEYFSGKLNAHFGITSDTDYNQKVIRFTETLLLLVTSLHVSVRRFGLAYTIFETLNTRGLDLTQADLIKNQIISMAQSQNDRDLVISNWNTMVTNLPDEDTAATEFIRTFYASSVEDVKAGELFAVIATHLSSQPVLDFSADLKNEAANYTRIVESNVAHTNTNDLLSEINNIFGVKMCNILLLSGAQVFGLVHTDFRRLVKITRDFCFRFMTVGSGGTPAKMEIIMGDAARILRTQRQLQPVLTLLQQKSPNQVFSDDFSKFQAKKPITAFYIIRQLEMHLSANAGQFVPFSQSPQQHLEHIMPKTLTTQGWSHVMNDERYSSYLNRIGNHLVLEANINTAIKNKSFDEKAGISGTVTPNYTDSNLTLPNQTQNYLASGLWDFEAIENRQQALSNIALSTWPLA